MFLFPILILLDTFAIIVGVFASIFLAFKARGEQDPFLKKQTKKKAWWSFLGPILLMIILMTLWAFIQIGSKA